MGEALGALLLRRSMLGLTLSVLGCTRVPPVTPGPYPVEPAPAKPAPSPAPAPGQPDKAPESAPRLRVEATRVLLDGRPLVPLERGTPHHVELLSEVMKARLSEAPPRSTLSPYHLTVAEDAKGAPLKSTVRTAATAGWPLALLHLGERSIALHTAVLSPSGKPMPSSLSWPAETLVIVVRGDSVELLRAIAPPRAPRSVASVPAAERSFEDESGRRLGKLAAGDVSRDLPELLRAVCEKGPPCSPAALVLADDAPFSVTHRALQALAAVPFESGPPVVELRVRSPEEPGTPRVEAGGVGPTRSGRLAPELIVKTVRASSDKYRQCYEAGLARDPKLVGKVIVRFMIDRDGRVPHATTGSETTIRDAGVTSCVVKHFRGLQFPAPEGGSVNVAYPLALPPE